MALEEPESDKAEYVLRGVVSTYARVVVPPLFDAECVSGLVKAVRRVRLSLDAAAERLLDLLSLPLERLPTASLSFDSFVLALRYGISAHDATYVALSDETGLPLVTADARLVRALAGSPHEVLLLDDVDL